jgi:hypothetical protein
MLVKLSQSMLKLSESISVIFIDSTKDDSQGMLSKLISSPGLLLAKEFVISLIALSKFHSLVFVKSISNVLRSMYSFIYSLF